MTPRVCAIRVCHTFLYTPWSLQPCSLFLLYMITYSLYLSSFLPFPEPLLDSDRSNFLWGNHVLMVWGSFLFPCLRSVSNSDLFGPLIVHSGSSCSAARLGLTVRSVGRVLGGPSAFRVCGLISYVTLSASFPLCIFLHFLGSDPASSRVAPDIPFLLYFNVKFLLIDISFSFPDSLPCYMTSTCELNQRNSAFLRWYFLIKYFHSALLAISSLRLKFHLSLLINFIT